MGTLSLLILLLLFIIIIGIVNERTVRLQGDIALVLFSLVISVIMLLFSKLPGLEQFRETVATVGNLGFESYLLDGVLCFMLFAGASKVNIRKFRQNIKAISLLALLTTVVSSTLYGLLFYVASSVFGLGLDIWTSILLGCIVSPTDPIAATGILNKLGLSKNVTSVIESESLFNDGTGVALFVFVKSIVMHSDEGNFLLLMLKELGGAIAVAVVVSLLLFSLLKLTNDPVKHILISILDVSAVYVICEHFGFSGVIASVVCGMLFAYKMDGITRRRQVVDPNELYADFWNVIDSILNSILFVMIGLSVLNMDISGHIFIIIPAAILFVFISRYAGVLISSLLIGKSRIPSSYSTAEFVLLMTWSALKGGLSLALAMSTRDFLSPEIYVSVLNTAYITIFYTVVVQGLTTKRVYQAIERHKAKRIRKQSTVAIFREGTEN